MICKRIKKAISIVLSMLFMVNILPSIRVFADDPSGSCGLYINYSFNPATGVLTITGKGEMDDIVPNIASMGNPGCCESSPWDSYKDDIKSVEIKHGITYIGWNTFKDCKNLISVIIPKSVTNIGTNAFSGCTNLRYVTYLGHKKLPSGVFDDCHKLVACRKDRQSCKIA